MAYSRFANSKEATFSSTCASIKFDGRYYIKSFIKKTSSYYMYQGVDAIASKYVTIYLKTTTNNFNFSKKIKAELRSKISPHLLWEGVYKQNGSTYNVQVHQKYGPSLHLMFQYVQDRFKTQDFLLLMYQLIRLLQKYSSVGYVFRELDMDQIVFDPKPEKNQLYLLNSFPLRRKGEDSPPIQGKYASRAAHLGLRACQKDDVQSVCYILLDIFTNGRFLKDVSPADYQMEKARFDFNSLDNSVPQVFKHFYHYVVSLNCNDEVNYFKWRGELFDLINKQAINQPYGWMTTKGLNSGSNLGLKVKTLKKDVQQLQLELLPEDRANLDHLNQKTLIKKALT